jgi:hypothetical protein
VVTSHLRHIQPKCGRYGRASGYIAFTIYRGVGKVYQQLKSILGTIAMQQVENSLQH